MSIRIDINTIVHTPLPPTPLPPSGSPEPINLSWGDN